MAVWLWADLLSVVATLQGVLRRPNRHMPVMNWVWPLVSLYFGPIGLLLFWVLGRGGAHRPMAAPVLRTAAQGLAHGAGLGGHAGHALPGGAEPAPPSAPHAAHGTAQDPLWMRSTRSATHCLAGCALGDLTAMVAVGTLGLTVAGSMLAAEVGLGAVLAFGFGLFIFQAFPIMAERGIPFARAFRLALAADLWTISAYLAGQIPAFLWLHSGSGTFDASSWVEMQVSMAVGFVASLPVNWWLVRAGLKEGM